MQTFKWHLRLVLSLLLELVDRDAHHWEDCCFIKKYTTHSSKSLLRPTQLSRLVIHSKKALFVDHWTRLWDFKSTKNVWNILLSMVVNFYMEERESKEKDILLNQQLSRQTKRLNSSKKSISAQSCLLSNSLHSNKLLKSTIVLVKGWAAVYSLKTSATLTSGLVH